MCVNGMKQIIVVDGYLSFSTNLRISHSTAKCVHKGFDIVHYFVFCFTAASG